MENSVRTYVNSVENVSLVNKINKMLEKSFNNPVYGNYVVFDRNIRSYAVQTKPAALRDIVELSKFEAHHPSLRDLLDIDLPETTLRYDRLGEFLPNTKGEYDGSIMKIHKDYEKQARNYAKEYMKLFSREPTIILEEHIQPSREKYSKKK